MWVSGGKRSKRSEAKPNKLCPDASLDFPFFRRYTRSTKLPSGHPPISDIKERNNTRPQTLTTATSQKSNLPPQEWQHESLVYAFDLLGQKPRIGLVTCEWWGLANKMIANSGRSQINCEAKIIIAKPKSRSKRSLQPYPWVYQLGVTPLAQCLRLSQYSLSSFGD